VNLFGCQHYKKEKQGERIQKRKSR